MDVNENNLPDQVHVDIHWLGRMKARFREVDRLMSMSVSIRIRLTLLTEHYCCKLFPSAFDQLYLHLSCRSLSRWDGTERSNFHEGSVKRRTAWTTLFTILALYGIEVHSVFCCSRFVFRELTLNQKTRRCFPADLLALAIIKLSANSKRRK